MVQTMNRNSTTTYNIGIAQRFCFGFHILLPLLFFSKFGLQVSSVRDIGTDKYDRYRLFDTIGIGL